MTSVQIQTNIHDYGSGGPIGAALMTVGLPAFTYMISFTCNDISGCPVPSLLSPRSFTLDKFAEEIGWDGLHTVFEWKTLIVTLGYYALTFILYAILPATEAHGTELRNGGRVKYRFNVFNTSLAILALLAAGTALHGADLPVWTFITAHHLPLLTSNLIIAFLLATYVYVNSFSLRPGQPTSPPHRELALGGATNNPFYNWFIGRELNPPVWILGLGHVDIKSYVETRPGLLGWLLLDLAFVAKQYGDYGSVTDSMLLVVFAQAVYVLDSFWNEPLIVTQIDITTDGFGFMLAFGDLVWSPFVFSLQARYLAVHPKTLGVLGVCGVVAVHAVGFYVFRASNGQKDTFRRRPDDASVKDLSFIPTKTGSRLLTGGWWGLARHVNYLGDWMLSWAYCLPTGIAGYQIHRSSPVGSLQRTPNGGHRTLAGDREVIPGDAYGWGMLVTYFYLIYFAVLLVHRQRRDDAKCLRKYGRDWEEYERQVPSRIIPGVY